MKKIIFIVMVIISIAGCKKEKELMTHQMSDNMAPAGSIQLNDSMAEMASSFLPCEQYPPTDPRSCNYYGGTDGEPAVIFPVINCQNGILVFNSHSDFYRTYFILDSLTENFSGYDFAMNYYNGNQDKIDSLLDVLNIDEDQSLVDFENKFTGFTSLRKNILSQENSFLENGGDPVAETNPDNKHYISDDIFRTMLSSSGVVKIENVFVKYFPNGVCYAVLNGSTQLLNQLTDIYSQIKFMTDTVNVKLLSPIFDPVGEQLPGDPLRLAGEDCKLWYKKYSPTVYYNNNKNKYFTKISVHNTFVFDGAGSVIKNYRKKSNGKWKRSRANMSASVHNSYYCSEFGKDKSTKYRKRRRATVVSQTVLPIVGQFSQGIMWLADNILSNSNGHYSNYKRYFKAVANYGYFYGNNYCNGQRQLVVSSW